jgi:hypothetical protein
MGKGDVEDLGVDDNFSNSIMKMFLDYVRNDVVPKKYRTPRTEPEGRCIKILFT